MKLNHEYAYTTNMPKPKPAETWRDTLNVCYYANFCVFILILVPILIFTQLLADGGDVACWLHEDKSGA